MLSRLKSYKLFRFVLVGISNTLVDLGILNLLVYFWGTVHVYSYSLYKSISFVFALLNSYFLNRYFTFQYRESNKKSFVLFLIFSVFAFVVNVIFSSFVFYILSKYNTFYLNGFSLVTLPAILGSIVSFLVNYLSYNYIVFK